MAIENYQPNGVKVERFGWGDYCTGTAAALIAAKLIEECDLPGQPGNNRLSVTRGDRREPGYIQIRRHPRKRSPDTFVVRIDASPEERERRLTAENSARRESQEIESAESLRAVNARLKEYFKSVPAAEVVENLRYLILTAARSVHDCTEGNTPRSELVYSFRLESEVGNEAVRLLNLAHDCLKGAKTTKDSVNQNAAAPEAFKRALHDRDFQRFLENQGMR